MTLSRGHRLGPYEILDPLGAGGMGEVHLARETRLDRTVAIKILPTHLSDKPAARERFEREAKIISSLNTSSTFGTGSWSRTPPSRSRRRGRSSTRGARPRVTPT